MRRLIMPMVMNMYRITLRLWFIMHLLIMNIILVGDMVMTEVLLILVGMVTPQELDIALQV